MHDANKFEVRKKLFENLQNKGLLILIAPLIGIIVRNALEYENTLLMQYKFIKLVDTSNECLVAYRSRI